MNLYITQFALEEDKSQDLSETLQTIRIAYAYLYQSTDESKLPRRAGKTQKASLPFKGSK